jgi:hypothetical protein
MSFELFDIHKNTFFVNTIEDVYNYLFLDYENVQQENSGCFLYGKRIGIFKQLMPEMTGKKTENYHCVRIWKTKTLFDYWYNTFNLLNEIISMDYFIRNDFVKLEFIVLCKEIKHNIKMFNNSNNKMKYDIDTFCRNNANNYLGLFLSAIMYVIRFAKKNNIHKLKMIVQKDEFLQFWQYFGFIQMNIKQHKLVLVELVLGN